MPVNSCEKGKRGERLIASIFRSWGFVARRGRQFKGTPDSPDVVVEDFPFQVESKFVQNLSLFKALQKAQEDANSGAACVIWKKNGERPVICMDLEEFLSYLKGVRDAAVKSD